MRAGALRPLVSSIVKAQFDIMVGAPGFRSDAESVFRNEGVNGVVDLLLVTALEIYVLTFGAALPQDLREPFKVEFRKQAEAIATEWLNSPTTEGDDA